MEDNRKISLCIPTWQRVDMTIEAFIEVYGDERISEIIIVDDASDLATFHQLKDICDKLDKVKLYRNVSNVDCYRNKKNAISFATNEWCVLLDSDNIIDRSYIDKIYEIEDWDVRTSYMPSFASPTFNYSDYSGLLISRKNVGEYIGMPLFDTMLNCFNFFINKTEYLMCFDPDINPHTADSIYFNYRWFDLGNVMYVVPNMQYYHRIHQQSHYINNNHKTGNLYNETLDLLRWMK